jgi:hypothetical protein
LQSNIYYYDETFLSDTLAFTKKLRNAGFTETQAEAQSEALKEIMTSQMATKRDLTDLEFRLTIKVGAMIAASIALIVSLVKLL